jgi:hypothetical protein
MVLGVGANTRFVIKHSRSEHAEYAVTYRALLGSTEAIAA